MSFFTLFKSKEPVPRIQSPLDRRRSDESTEAPLKQKICVCNPTKINESSYKILSNIDKTSDGRLEICGDENNGNSGIKVCLPSFASDDPNAPQIDTNTTLALTMYTKNYTGDTGEKQKMSFEDIMGEIEMLHEFEDITPILKGVFFITNPDKHETSTPETITPETSEHKTYKISGYTGVINNNIFIAGSDILNMQDAISEIKDKIQIVVLLMEKCNTNYNIEDASGILSLIDSIVNKGFIGVDFKENNLCGRINGEGEGEGKLLLIDTDKSMHLKISEDQKEISKQYMILLFISELYSTWLWYKDTNQTNTPSAKRFYKILGIMVRSYVTSYYVDFEKSEGYYEKLNEHFEALLTNIDPITSVLPTRTPILRLIFYMPLLPDTLKFKRDANILNEIKRETVPPNDGVTKTRTIAAAIMNLNFMFQDFNILFFKTKGGGKTRRKRNKSKSKRKTKTKR
jgi:hypothetical protein